MKKIICLLFLLICLLTLVSCKNNHLSNEQVTGEIIIENNGTTAPINKPVENNNNNNSKEKYINIGVIGSNSEYYSKSTSAAILGIQYANYLYPKVTLTDYTYKVNLIIADNVNNYEDAEKAVDTLLSKNVKAVIGCGKSYITDKVASLLEKKNISFITIADCITDICEKYDNTFTLVSYDSSIGTRCGEFISSKLKSKKVLILTALGDESSQTKAFYCNQYLKSKGINNKIVSFDNKKPNFNDLFNELSKDKYDLVYAPVSFACDEGLINAMANTNIKNLLGDIQLQNNKAVSLCDSNGIKLYVCSDTTYDSSSDSSIDFMNWLGSNYKRGSSIDETENALSYNGYNAYKMIYNIMEINKSYGKKNLMNSLDSIVYSGLFDDISFNKVGERKQKMQVYIYSNKAWNKV